MRVFLSALALLLMCVPSSGVAGNGPDDGAYTPVTAFDPARNAAKDIDAAVAFAAKTGRNVLLDVGGEWCIWCRRLDTLFAKHADLSRLRDSNFVTVKINYSKENKNEKVLSRYPKIPGYPHLFVLDRQGKLLSSQSSGDLESGKGHDPEKVRAFLKRWTPK